MEALGMNLEKVQTQTRSQSRGGTQVKSFCVDSSVQTFNNTTAPRGNQTEDQSSSLYIFPPEDRFRQFCTRIVETPIFTRTILIAVITSTALLVLKNDGNAADPFWSNLDLVCVTLFVIDLWCKVVASGFFTFLSDPMNVLDALCTLASLVTLFPVVSEATGLGAVKPLRTLRLLQPIRTFREFQTLRVLTETLFNSSKAYFTIGANFISTLHYY
ncbi:hypothetical protein CYMTET_28948 [Cymbomonas tetramitiformis]|uniref:Ion transport domain-containing protein n=1 Tax=Cymbomonas tetramitiformis TaxID=36881 RepID=A0AAE0FLS8_9CHLO|nr:hypothetical protein CYMTET_28948 [Cymbomonas tetramitiformis]